MMLLFYLENKRSKPFYKISKKVKIIRLNLLSESKNIFLSIINFLKEYL